MATMSARYTVIDGEVVAQERGGVRHQLVPDPLGSTVAHYDSAGTKTDAFSYWPYGESSGRTGITTAKFQYVGNAGYYQDSATKLYVRARFLDAKAARWITEDPMSFDSGDFDLYRYSMSNPTNLIDPSGLFCIKIGNDCFGTTCWGRPDCPPQDQDSPLLPCAKDWVCTIVCSVRPWKGKNPPKECPPCSVGSASGPNAPNACKEAEENARANLPSQCRAFMGHCKPCKCAK